MASYYKEILNVHTFYYIIQLRALYNLLQILGLFRVLKMINGKSVKAHKKGSQLNFHDTLFKQYWL